MQVSKGLRVSRRPANIHAVDRIDITEAEVENGLVTAQKTVSTGLPSRPCLLPAGNRELRARGISFALRANEFYLDALPANSVVGKQSHWAVEMIRYKVWS